MSSSLIEKQIAFAQCVGNLLTWAPQQGILVVLGETWRAPQQCDWNASRCAAQVSGVRCERERLDLVHTSGGHPFVPIGLADSLHGLRLAIDLVRMIPTADGGFQPAVGRDKYAPLGEYWEQHQGAVWGGSWGSDYGHFSMPHNGRK